MLNRQSTLHILESRDQLKQHHHHNFFLKFLLLTVGVSRLMEAQMDLPRLLFGVGFQIFFHSDASNVYVLS